MVTPILQTQKPRHRKVTHSRSHPGREQRTQAVWFQSSRAKWLRCVAFHNPVCRDGLNAQDRSSTAPSTFHTSFYLQSDIKRQMLFYRERSLELRG